MITSPIIILNILKIRFFIVQNVLSNGCSQITANVYVYEMLRVCVRGFSEGKSEANKRATNFGLGKTSNFLYTLL